MIYFVGKIGADIAKYLQYCSMVDYKADIYCNQDINVDLFIGYVTDKR